MSNHTKVIDDGGNYLKKKKQNKIKRKEKENFSFLLQCLVEFY